MNESPEDRLGHARAAAIFKAPYFSSIIYGFVPHPLEGIGTMLCTPTMILGYDPQWAMVATIDELAADIVHEAQHFIRRHFERAAHMADREAFNLAGDFAINTDMRAAGWKLAEGPKGAVYPEMYGLPPGKTTEEYYALLQQMKAQQQAPSAGADASGQQGGQSGDQTQGPSPPEQQPSPGSSPPAQGQDPGQGEGPKGVGRGHCGGIGGASPSPDLEKQLESLPGLGRPAAEVKSIEKRVAVDIKQHTEKFGRGSVPGDLVDLLDKFSEESTVRWEDELAHVVRDTTGRLQSGGDDFSMRRPSKRSFIRGFPRPGLIEHLPEVAVVRDTSGSMGAKQLTAATREAYRIIQALGIEEVWYADADTRVATPWCRAGTQFFRDLRAAHGRGGTDFRPAIESAQKLSPKPDLLIYITDGDGTTTKMPPPNLAVIWCVVPGHFNKAPARWGRTVIISDNPKKRNAPVAAPDDD